jgi:hypothetical protein
VPKWGELGHPLQSADPDAGGSPERGASTVKDGHPA